MTDALAASPLARAIGYALVQFVWQGAVIGLATALILTALRRATPQARYLAAALGLALMAAAPIATIAGEWRQPPAFQPAVLPGSPGGSASVVHLTASEAAPAAAPLAVAPLSADTLAPFLPAVVLVWSAGVVIFAFSLLLSWRRAGVIRRTATPLTSGRWPARVREIARGLGVQRRFTLAESGLVQMPSVIGWLRPAIVVPTSALAGLPPDILEAILAHEIAHVRRGDYLVNVLQCLVETLLFYHPAVWWVSRRMRVEREHCCDDIASTLSADRVAYARALTSLEELLADAPAVSVAANGGDLLNRIRRLLEPDRASGPRWSGGVVMGVVMAVLLVAVSGSTQSMPEPLDRATSQEVGQAETASPAPGERVVVSAGSPVSRPAPAPPRGSVSPAPAPAPPALPGSADQGRAAISGRVMDASGGVIPGASVSVRAAGAEVRTAISNVRGEFVIANLPAGPYELTVSMSGFRTARSRLEVKDQVDVRVDVRLELGSLVETVMVTGQRPSQAAAVTAATRPAPWPNTAADYMDAAKMYYTQGRLADAEAMATRALELMREGRPQIVPVPPPPPPPPADPSLPSAPIRVGGDIKEPRKIRDVRPIYPDIALAAAVQGTVILEATIAPDGTVTDARILRSVPLLDQAAIDAVRQWAFTPTLLNNVAVPVAMTVSVIFQIR